MTLGPNTCPHPTPQVTYELLVRVGELLGVQRCWRVGPTYHFRVAPEWTLGLSPESAGRVRLDACRRGAVRATLWARAEDDDRLAAAVLGLADNVLVREGV